MSPAASNYVVFSDDWGVHPSSSQHLFRHIARDYSVLWVNTIGMRNPTFTLRDLRKAWHKIVNMLSGAQRTTTVTAQPAGLTVCQPFMLPFSNLSWVRAFNRWSVLRKVNSELRRLGMLQPIMVSTVPNACDFTDGLQVRRVVYYCVDDFTQWPGLERRLVSSMEAQLIAGADVLIATSNKLLTMLAAHGKPVTLLTHGVDVDLFASAPGREHPCLSAIPAPRIGYYGLFDERSDQALLAAVAQALPDHSFVITGPVATDTTRLGACTNVYFTGAVAYSELPLLVYGLQALCIPYVVNSFTDSISPLKLKEYLATGKPVIVTAMAEALLLKDRISIATTVPEWVAAIRNAPAVDVDARRRDLLGQLQQESWSSKARQFIGLCAAEQGAGSAT